ncbi:MAG: lasso peptide biosynthesis B2 protein [Balneolales bacterium]
MRIPGFLRFFKKPLSTQFMLTEALLLVAVTRFVIFCMPYKMLARMIRSARREERIVRQREKGSHSSGPHQADTLAWNVANSVESVSRRVPWKSTCLVQAAAGKIMLNRRRLPATLYLGVNKNLREAGSIKPHAWLTSGPTVVIGGDIDKYVIVSEFN